MTSSPLPRPARLAGVVFAWVLGALLVVFVVAGVWIGVRGATAYGHLRAAEQTARGAADLLSDPAAAAELISDLAEDTHAARALTSDPVWAVAEHLPWIGPQLTAVSTVAAAIDDIASEALSPLTEAASNFSVETLKPVDGHLDLEVFQAISPAAREGASGIAEAAASVSEINQAALLGPVREGIAEVEDLLLTTVQSTDALARATTLLPAMLGADGDRDYLIVFQNNAEWRSLGGIVGAMAVVHTSGGGMDLVDQGSSSDFRRYDEPVLPLDPEVRAIFDTHPARWVQNVTQVPDFSVSGALAREMWKREKGLEVDGVIAMDPVALSYVLKATGPVLLPTGDELTADNAVQLLLNDVYLRYERPADQDAFFAAAAAAVFDKLATGSADPASLVAALGRAGDERRLLLWSAIPEDQAVLEGTTLVGPLPPTDRDQVGFGVFLNDGTGSKMNFYVDAQTTLEWATCTLDATGQATGDVTLTVTITNNAPADAATSLPDYITGGGYFGTPPGIAKTVGYLYLPPGFNLSFSSLTDGGGFGGGFHQGRQVLTFGSSLAPGESVTATLTARSSAAGAAKAVAWATPTIHADQPTSVVARCAAP